MDNADQKLVPLPRPAAIERSVSATIQKAKEEIFIEAMDIIRGAAHGRDVYDPLNNGPLQEGTLELDQTLLRWEAELGSRSKAKARLRAAQAACRSQKDAPLFLNLAKSVVIGMAKADALASAGNRELNINFVKIEVTPPNYEIITEAESVDGND